MNYGERESTRKCPYCGTKCYADFVDIGIGYEQCGPYHCERCMASEIGPHDVKTRKISKEEERTGWYEPYTEAGSSANIDDDGRHISYQEADTLYREKCGVAPRYNKKRKPNMNKLLFGDDIIEYECQGHLYGYKNNSYISSRGDIVEKHTFTKYKRKSCKGCGECWGIMEMLPDEMECGMIPFPNDLQHGDSVLLTAINDGRGFEDLYDEYHLEFVKVK